MNLGKRVEQERKALGLSQQQLADKVSPRPLDDEKGGLTQQALDRLEKRDSKTSEFAVGLADALGVSLRWLLCGDGKKTDAEWPFRYIRPEEWGGLLPHERAAMEEAALEKLRDLRSGVSRVASLRPAPAPNFDALSVAVADFGRAVKAQVLGTAGSATGADQAVDLAFRKVFAVAGAQWPSAQQLPQGQPAETRTP